MILTKYAKFLESIQQKDMWEIIPDSVKEIHSLFQYAGKKLYVVGGSVRDFLNSDNPKDFDLATDATPNEILKIIGNKYRTTTQGESFFVVVVYTQDQPKGMEIATFREDIYGDLLGKTRNPSVKFSTIEKDVNRRDITYNSLFYDLKNRKIVDLVGGLEDLRDGISKFVGDPDMRIKEDPLRILRLFRFTSRYGFVIDEKTSESIKKNKSQLNIIVQGRIWEEFYKAFEQVKDFSIYLRYLNEYLLWEYIFPNIAINGNITKCKYLENYLANLFKEEIVLNFKSFHDKLVQSYLIPGDIAQVVTFLIWFQSFSPERISDFYNKRNNYKESNNPITNGILYEWIELSDLKGKEFKSFVEYRPISSSEDLMKKGFKGKLLGDELKRIEIENFKNLIL